MIKTQSKSFSALPKRISESKKLSDENVVGPLFWDTTPPYLSPNLPFECFQLLYKDMGAIRHYIGNPNIGGFIWMLV